MSQVAIFAVVFVVLVLLHFPLLHLPYFWDEAGYYIPAALDFFRSWRLTPETTLPTGHTPLVTVYLGSLWRIFGFSPIVTRVGMLFAAAASVAALYALARCVARKESAAWSALLLAVSPLFFAQSSLAHLDLAAGLFTTLALLALMRRQWGLFALTASLAVLSKETAVVLLPVAWIYAWRRVGARHAVPLRHGTWVALAAPLLPLIAWAFYYRHATGFWTGNPEYLQYNLYANLDPLRFLVTLFRRLYEVFVGGFNWVLIAGAVLGFLQGRNHSPSSGEIPPEDDPSRFRDFKFVAIGVSVVYLLMLSLVGGAVLPRYLLPVFPLVYLAAVVFIFRLPKLLARAICLAAAGCFVATWFINPPYPFPFEDNLSYADFVRLHQQAARTLESQPGAPRILTAWPASDELTRPFLGYVQKPLRVVPLRGFTPDDFRDVSPDSFDVLYLYSRKWEPENNWLRHFVSSLEVRRHYFEYEPQIREEELVARYRLKLLRTFERRWQWGKIYVRQGDSEFLSRQSAGPH